MLTFLNTDSILKRNLGKLNWKVSKDFLQNNINCKFQKKKNSCKTIRCKNSKVTKWITVNEMIWKLRKASVENPLFQNPQNLSCLYFATLEKPKHESISSWWLWKSRPCNFNYICSLDFHLIFWLMRESQIKEKSVSGVNR